VNAKAEREGEDDGTVLDKEIGIAGAAVADTRTPRRRIARTDDAIVDALSAARRLRPQNGLERGDLGVLLR
jgi:hypothetical protein